MHGPDPDVKRLCNSRQGKRETDAKDNTKTVDHPDVCPEDPQTLKPDTLEGPPKKTTKTRAKKNAKPTAKPRKTLKR